MGLLHTAQKCLGMIFLMSLQKKSIHVPSNKRDELYKHLMETRRIYKIEKFIHGVNRKL
jgi:hypothetical protein